MANVVPYGYGRVTQRKPRMTVAEMRAEWVGHRVKSSVWQSGRSSFVDLEGTCTRDETVAASEGEGP